MNPSLDVATNRVGRPAVGFGSLSVGVAEDLPAWLDVSSVSGESLVAVRARTASGDVINYRA